ncbi:MAG: hypothetical protein IPN95_19130 [Bacteroidetes bacterium]|nr:hypothetical protein [Bacteroidota bacterium]
MIIFDEMSRTIDQVAFGERLSEYFHSKRISAEFDLEVGNVREHGGLLITEDKDFGELIFSHHIEKVACYLFANTNRHIPD